MKEIAIKIPDNMLDVIKNSENTTWLAVTYGNQLVWQVKNGKVLPKGHTELIDTKKLIQSVARSADNMKDNGVAPVFDLHEITNLILTQDVLVESDKEKE